MRTFTMTLCLCLALSVSSAPAVDRAAAADLSLAADTSTNDAPPFCRGIACPSYEVVGKGKGYEVRKYEATKWATTDVKDMSLEEAERTGFMRLFGYISGANEDSTTIPMTAPVKTYITPGEGPFCGSNFTISFFVPPDRQQATPPPTSSLVRLTQEPPVTAYVAEFPGFAREATVVQRASELAAALQADGVKFDPEHYVSAGYDAPFRLVGRHNEIWFFAA